MNSNELIEKAKKFEDTIVNLTEQVKGFREQLENAETDEDKKFKRVAKSKPYYSVGFQKGVAVVQVIIEGNTPLDDSLFNNNNYFITRERAQEVVDKLNHLMRLERLHDELCPDFKPNFKKDGAEKWQIAYNHIEQSYMISPQYRICEELKSTTCFPKRDIAQKVCDILNAELEQQKEV